MSIANIVRTKDVHIDEDVNFESLITNKDILRGLTEAGYDRPSPIQLKAIPPGKLGLDVIAQAKSGTGKTIVFGIISLEILDLSKLRPQVLILAPTREIAVQTKEVICNIGRYLNGLECHVFIGGLPVEEDFQKLRKCHIAIGSPDILLIEEISTGRIGLLLSNKHMVADDIKLLVLDEADKLMERNFVAQLKKINSRLPQIKQVLSFSATYDKALLKTLGKFVQNPHYIMLSEGTPSLEGVLQYFQMVRTLDTDNAVEKFKFYEEKFKKLADLLSRVPFYQCIVFLNHRGRAIDLANYLTSQGWMALNISGGLDQKTRLETMSKARSFQIRVLVCSDLIARGIDIDRVNLVVNLDMPKDAETYLHRVGRTGRYGTHGLAISFVDNDGLEFLNNLKQNYHVDINALPDKISYQHHQRPLTAENDKEAYEKLLSERESIKTKIPEPLPVVFSEDFDNTTHRRLDVNKEIKKDEETEGNSHINNAHYQQEDYPQYYGNQQFENWHYNPYLYYYQPCPPCPTCYSQHLHCYDRMVPVKHGGGGNDLYGKEVKSNDDIFLPPDLPF
ncbi:12879_t:CDS:10 [Acaulospora colombiana]|uniref:12879_t:CDS:1 n=1 Tax=Acaulospora colombiana TaxID=27376 RepID=A0ACA9M1U1_9GLOM|nr:12879_t:CDS:10 [Acaulospora colombiana]